MQRNRFVAVGFVGLWALLGFVSVGLAQDGDKAFTSLSNERLEKILKGLGKEVKMQPTESPDQARGIFKVGQQEYDIWNFKTALMLRVVIQHKTTLQKVNDWNRDQFLCRAWLNPDREGVLESDLDLAISVKPQGIKIFLNRFEEKVKLFGQHIGARPGGGKPDNGASAGALTSWVEFTLRPRDLFDGTPLYP